MYDLVIIGGGVNGCGIARDAAGRGLSVLLAEQNDLASATSSASTKLIHGGLRYLENYEFRLVRESLLEREVLWAMAPHIIHPLRFILPHHKGLRPAWLIRLGLFLYDHLGGRKLLPACRSIDLAKDAAGRPLKDTFVKGFEYSDCRVDDARLVVLNAMDAADRGAEIAVRTEVTGAKRENDFWRIELTDRQTGAISNVTARALINATGPWVEAVQKSCLESRPRFHVRLVKGSHIVVPKIFDHDRAYIFQNPDNRIIFAIPYQDDFTLIGTTDVDITDQSDQGEGAKISDQEIAYLCDAVSEYFRAPLSPDQIVWSYSGVRPLFDDGEDRAQKTTREYVLELQKHENKAALLNVYGGKITAYRSLASEVLEKLAPEFPHMKDPWTVNSKLPGGDFAVDGLEAQIDLLNRQCPVLEPSMSRRLIRTYGTRARQIVEGVAKTSDLGLHFGADLYQREVQYLMDFEWAVTADDILWRRTKLGLRLTTEQQEKLNDWIYSRN